MTGTRPAKRWAPKLPDDGAKGRDLQRRVLWDIMADPVLSHATKNAAWALHEALNRESGWTWTSAETIGNRVGLHRSDARRHLAALEGGERPTPRAPKRSERYVHARKVGSPGHESTWRCFVFSEASPGGISPPLEQSRAGNSVPAQG
jgi:hypothetical protein